MPRNNWKIIGSTTMWEKPLTREERYKKQRQVERNLKKTKRMSINELAEEAKSYDGRIKNVTTSTAI